jgi:CubicO group peptidase (beta-lactamase class C family)
VEAAMTEQATRAGERAQARVEGECDARFARVREAFAANFERGEVGAALAVYVDGRTVVDLWGGFADAARTRPWSRDTIANVYSTTKGMTAICAHRLVEQGKLDLDAPVARYWPEFAQAGKQDLPVRYLLTHQAGLAAISKPVDPAKRYDWSYLVRALAEQKPWWEPGSAHGYHALTFGYLVGEVVRRVSGRSLGTFFRDEVAGPLGLDFAIGTPASEDARIAEMLPAPPPPPGAPNPFAAAAANPESLVGRAFANPPAQAGAVNTRAWRGAEIPAANGHGTARALARVYGALAQGGALDGVRVLARESIERASAEQVFGTDLVLSPLPTRFGLGFMLTQPMIPFGPNPRTFGHPGAGGSIAFADPDARAGFAYVMNQMQMGLAGDARGFGLIREVYAALA